MDCRTFREHHGAFLDDTLPGVDDAAMERHRAECAECAAFDVRMRRGLLVLHNLPRVHCSAGFNERLLARLQDLSPDRAPVHTVLGGSRTPGMFSFLAVAAAVLAVTAGAYSLLPVERAPVMLPPVIASQPAPLPDPFSSPAIVASAFAGAPVWPAMLLADEMPMHVAEVGFQLTGYVR